MSYRRLVLVIEALRVLDLADVGDECVPHSDLFSVISRGNTGQQEVEHVQGIHKVRVA